MDEADSAFTYQPAPDGAHEEQQESGPSLIDEFRTWVYYRRRLLVAAAAAVIGGFGFLACAVAFLDATLQLPHLLTLLLPELFVVVVAVVVRVAVKSGEDGQALARLAFRVMWALLIAAVGIDLTTAIIYGYGVMWGAVVTLLPVAATMPYLAYAGVARPAIHALRRGA